MSYITNYGPDNPCTLNTCPIETCLYTYRPSLGANAFFLAIFAVALIMHTYQGLRWRTWAFLFAMFFGFICEIIGYAGRIMLWQNPFSFNGFLIQIICITIAPAWFSAAIYLTLAKIITFLGPSYSRLPPRLYYWLFIPCDIVSLTLQGTGGGMSSTAGTSSDPHASPQNGVHISIAGLAFQVFTLTLFILLAIDYAISYRKHAPRESKMDQRFKIFIAFLALAVLCIFIRCVFRIDELSSGYAGAVFHNQGLFIGLEGVMIVIAVFALNIAHPGPVFHDAKRMEGHGGSGLDGEFGKA